MSKIQVFKNFNDIEGLCVIEPKVFADKRGYMMESYNEAEFAEEGLFFRFVQDNEAFSHKGVLRGFHVNRKYHQAKLIRVVSGEIYDVVIDLRRDSKTYKKWSGIFLSAENKKQLYIPKGFAHAYQAVNDSVVIFKVTEYWVPGDEVCFSWNSKDFDIIWPIDDPIQNESERCSQDFSVIQF